MKNIIGAIFCLSFFSFISGAEQPNNSLFATRNKNLGDTGASSSPSRLQRAKTIRLTMPAPTPKMEKKLVPSPRSDCDFNKVRDLPVKLPQVDVKK